MTTAVPSLVQLRNGLTVVENVDLAIGVGMRAEPRVSQTTEQT